MCTYIVAVILILVYANIPCYAWRDESFIVNSKLPTQCGRLSNYSPENKYTPWGNWPWLGFLTYDDYDSTSCICVLIHPQVVLTGSLCVRNVQSKFDETLRVGFSFRGLPSYQSIIITHVDFSDPNPNSNSIAIMKLNDPVTTSTAVQPICLWEENHDYSVQLDSQIGMVIGSDVINIENINSLRILQMTVRIVEKTQCENNLRKTLRNSICFTYAKESQTCHHIGSQMMIPRLSDDGPIVWYLRGLLTERIRNCRDGNIHILHDLADQRRWIESHFKPSIESSCGRRKIPIAPLITLGYEAVRGDFPWHIAIYKIKKDRTIAYHCGASLISNLFAITAGHCVSTSTLIYSPNDFRLALGKHDLQSKENGIQEINISKIILHEDFNYSLLQNDIALLKFEQSITFNNYIQPICMWDETNVDKKNVFGMQGKIPGWGLNENQELSQYLNVASIPILDDYQCLRSDNPFFQRYLNNMTFCAGNPIGNGTNVCNGDSGGGLILPIAQGDQIFTWYLRGIVSLSIAKPNTRLCDPNKYAIFTDVAQYLKWINKKITENS